MTKAKSAFGKPFLVRPDGKGRITLGAVARGVSGFVVSKDAEGTLTLVPQMEIPAREIWIWQNPSVMQALTEGMQQSRDGKVVEVDFSQFADLPVDAAD